MERRRPGRPGPHRPGGPLSLAEDGFALAGRALPDPACAALAEALAPLWGADGRGGVRHLLARSPEARAFAAGPGREAAAAALGGSATCVRALLFDKTPGANWKVIWHQDLTVALAARAEAPGFGPWTEKGGVPHAHAPVALLERMVAVRLHLDPCGADNGPLRVLPGSHRAGRLSAAEVAGWRARVPERACTAGRGELLLMRPLLLHASSPARAPGHRRVLHLEYAAADLPPGLAWAEAA